MLFDILQLKLVKHNQNRYTPPRTTNYFHLSGLFYTFVKQNIFVTSN